MTDLQFVFWNFTLEQLLLAAGRYTLMVSAALLTLKHAAWFVRLRHRRERRRKKVVRSAIELIAAACVAGVYAHAIYLGGPAAELGDAGSLVRVWAFALLFVGLVVSRGETPPEARP